MNAKDTVAFLRERMTGIDPRTGSVSAEWLHQQLVEVERRTPEISEIQKQNHSFQLEQYKAHLVSQNESFKASLDFAKVALSTTFLLNGGGAVALLTVIGQSIVHKQVMPNLWSVVVLFGFGAVAAVAALAAAFFAQEQSTVVEPNSRFAPLWLRWRRTVVFLELISLLMFLVGIATGAVLLSR
jgi:hypothetical protein